MENLPMRGAIITLKNLRKTELVGAEVGVYTGFNALCMLQNLNIKKLYLIDPYEVYDDYPDETVNATLEQAEQTSLMILKKYKDKIRWITKRASDAINDIPELDFVYIDGNHKYKYVKEDIKNYYSKLKKGGLLAGHDFGVHCPGVVKAVEEFARENNLDFWTHDIDWWMTK